MIVFCSESVSQHFHACNCFIRCTFCYKPLKGRLREPKLASFGSLILYRPKPSATPTATTQGTSTCSCAHSWGFANLSILQNPKATQRPSCGFRKVSYPNQKLKTEKGNYANLGGPSSSKNSRIFELKTNLPDLN